MSKRTLMIIIWGFAAAAWSFAGYTNAIRYGWVPSWANLFLPAECRGAPAVVPFHQGMTLCPGQSAIVTIDFAEPEPRKDGI